MRWIRIIAAQLTIFILIFPGCLVWMDTCSGIDGSTEGSPFWRNDQELMLYVSMDSYILHSGNSTGIVVTVTDQDGPANNVSLDFSSSKGVFDPETTNTNSSGKASVNYTAPVVARTQNVIMTVISNRTQGDENRTEVVVRILSSVDKIPPAIEFVVPANNSHNVSVDTSITIAFSEPMNGSSVAAAMSTDPAFEYTLEWNVDNLSIDPSSSLLPNTNYTVNLSNNATDFYGNPLDEAFFVIFTTGPAPSKEEMILNLTGLSAEIYGGSIVNISLRAVNRTGIPLMGVNLTFNVTGPASTAAPWGLTDAFGYFNTSVSAYNVTSNDSFQLRIEARKDNFFKFETNRTVTIVSRVSLPGLDISFTYLPNLYSLEYQLIGISVQWNSSAVENCPIILESSGGSLSPDSGMTDSLGLFEATYTAPDTSVPVTIDIFIIVSKTGFRTNRTTLKVMVRPLMEYEIRDDIVLVNGSRAEITASAEGTVKAVIVESVNPTPFTQGFMDMFIKINVTGQGRLLWVNISIKYLFVPKDRDEDTMAMYSLRSPDGPWVKCLHTGVFPSSNTVWANISWANTSEPHIFAPRTKDTSTPPRRCSQEE